MWPRGADFSQGSAGILPASAPAAFSRRCRAASPYQGKTQDCKNQGQDEEVASSSSFPMSPDYSSPSLPKCIDMGNGRLAFFAHR